MCHNRTAGPEGEGRGGQEAQGSDIHLRQDPGANMEPLQSFAACWGQAAEKPPHPRQNSAGEGSWVQHRVNRIGGHLPLAQHHHP